MSVKVSWRANVGANCFHNSKCCRENEIGTYVCVYLRYLHISFFLQLLQPTPENERQKTPKQTNQEEMRNSLKNSHPNFTTHLVRFVWSEPILHGAAADSFIGSTSGPRKPNHPAEESLGTGHQQFTSEEWKSSRFRYHLSSNKCLGVRTLIYESVHSIRKHWLLEFSQTLNLTTIFLDFSGKHIARSRP